MDKRGLIKAISVLLKENNIKRPISIPKQVFTFSDNEGNSKSFSIKKRDKYEIYTINDVTNIIEAALAIILDQIKHGGEIEIRGFGKLGVRYREARSTKDVNTGEPITIAPRYVPRFNFGNELRNCAKIYGMSLSDRMPEQESLYTDEEIAELYGDFEDGD